LTLPARFSAVRDPSEVTLGCAAVERVPASVVPVMDPEEVSEVTVVLLRLVVPVALRVTVLVVVALNFSASTSPSKSVYLGCEITFWNTSEIGFPWTVRLSQLMFVAATSTASMFLIWAFIVVGTNRGLCPHKLMLVNIIFSGNFISDLVPPLEIARKHEVGVSLRQVHREEVVELVCGRPKDTLEFGFV
jgi:hypothetical protein